jgi:hypothetical protein
MKIKNQKKLILLMHKFLFVLMLYNVNCSGQELPTDPNGKVIYNEVVNADSISAADLYSRSKIWFAEAFKSANNVIQSDDERLHIIIGKGNTPFYINGLFGVKTESGTLFFSVKIESKEGRYKYTITDFYMKNNAGEWSVESYRGTGGQIDNYYKQVDDLGKMLSASIKIAMKKNIGATNNEW